MVQRSGAGLGLLGCVRTLRGGGRGGRDRVWLVLSGRAAMLRHACMKLLVVHGPFLTGPPRRPLCTAGRQCVPSRTAAQPLSPSLAAGGEWITTPGFTFVSWLLALGQGWW